jgi:hypothetical protein
VKWEPKFEGFGSFWESLVPTVLLEEDSDGEDHPLVIDENSGSDLQHSDDSIVSILEIPFPREPLPKQPNPLRQYRKPKSPKNPNPWCVKPVGVEGSRDSISERGAALYSAA